jgi:hypothetical protein
MPRDFVWLAGEGVTWVSCDNALIQNLCDILAQILGDTPLVMGELDECFSPRLGQLLTLGVNNTLARCICVIHPELVTCCILWGQEGPSRCWVDTGIFVDFQQAIENRQARARVLEEAKSPSVMEHLRHRLPHNGAILKWTPGGSVLVKLLLKVTSVASCLPKIT